VDLKWLRNLIGAGVITLLFVSCGAKYHLNRAIAKDPTILDSVVLKWDTTIVTEKQEIRDTLILQMVDTIRIEKDGIRVDLRRSYDTIEVNVECPPDTITIQKEIQVPHVVYQEKKFRSIYIWILVVSIILYTFMLIKLLK